MREALAATADLPHYHVIALSRYREQGSAGALMRKPKTFRADAGWRVIVEREHANGDLSQTIHVVTHWQISRAAATS